MKKIFLISITILLCSSSNCNKEPTAGEWPQKLNTVCTSSNTAFIPADARSRFYFEKGSRWVYKNTATSELDTIKLEKCDRYVEEPTPQLFGNIPNKCYERAIIKFRSDKYDYHNTRIEFRQPKSEMDSTKEIYTIVDTYTYDARVMTSYKLVYKGLIVYPNQDSGTIAYYDSMELNGKTYSDILNYQTSKPTDYITDIYYAKYYGVIKMRRTDGTTWELINSNIIK